MQKGKSKDKEAVKQNLTDDDKIWRISSLTMFIDTDTKILLLPMAESKRKIKIRDTKYDFQSIHDLIECSDKIHSDLTIQSAPEQQKRYEDKTTDEIN